MSNSQFDDSDIKIAGAPVTADHFDAAALMEETRSQRFNGNMRRAKLLGSDIVSSFSYRAASEELEMLAKEYGVELDDAVLLQVRILSVFSAEYCLEKYLPGSSLSTIAINEMYEVLMDISPDFYRTLSESAAFTFYHLCISGDKPDTALLGETFANLSCGKNCPDCAKFGICLFETNLKVYREAIGSIVFA